MSRTARYIIESFHKISICLLCLLSVSCTRDCITESEIQNEIINIKNRFESDSAYNDSCIYNPDWMPFNELRHYIGDGISDVDYMDSIYGEPQCVQTELVYYGKFGRGLYDLDGVSENISKIPECVVKYYSWHIYPKHILSVYYLQTDDGLIPIGGEQYNTDLEFVLDCTD